MKQGTSPILADLPTDKPSCANCTYNGSMCVRKKLHPKGYVLNYLTKELGGIVALCVHYQGKFSKPATQLSLSL